ncbi:fimbrial protein [Achromobacter xylosoxidans]
MFKKTLLATAATAALLGPVAAFAAGEMGQGTITFTGAVLEAPCSIEATDTNLAVDLGQVSKKSLSAAGKYGNSVPIEIHLKGCNFGTAGAGATTPPGSKVAIKFPGQTGTDGMIPNTLGNAQNVSIQLLQANGTSKVNFDAGDPGTQMVDGANTLSFFARITATATGVTAGTVSSKVTYMLDYK